MVRVVTEQCGEIRVQRLCLRIVSAPKAREEGVRVRSPPAAARSSDRRLHALCLGPSLTGRGAALLPLLSPSLLLGEEAVRVGIQQCARKRQTVLLDGGDNLAYLVILMLLLTRCYDRFSFSSGIGKKIVNRLPGQVRAIGDPLHNIGVVAIALQVCLVYVVSGLYKVQGQMWQDGTALFYVLRVPEFTFPALSHFVYENDFLVFSGTYVTVLFLVYFPLGILVPALRPWAAVMPIGFHLGIALLMGLTGFALTMVACDLVFLSRGSTKRSP